MKTDYLVTNLKFFAISILLTISVRLIILFEVKYQISAYIGSMFVEIIFNVFVFGTFAFFIFAIYKTKKTWFISLLIYGFIAYYLVELWFVGIMTIERNFI